MRRPLTQSGRWHMGFPGHVSRIRSSSLSRMFYIFVFS